MANKNIDLLHAAEAESLVIAIRGKLADARAELLVLECRLEIAKEQAIAARVTP
jgi:hypothetical protein